jgi:hypothetical protein
VIEGGYEIYMAENASCGTSKAAHDYPMLRMIQVGVVPVTWQQVLWNGSATGRTKSTYEAVMAIVKEHSGAYGIGVDTMVHHAPESASCAGRRWPLSPPPRWNPSQPPRDHRRSRSERPPRSSSAIGRSA